MIKKPLSIMAILLIAINSFGKITLPSVFTDNMVLQQNTEVAIWGWGEPNEKIALVGSWKNTDTIKVTTSNNARWIAHIKTTNAGGPYTLKISGSSKIELQNVMLGEVWICSGQSNMEMSVNWGIKNGNEEAAQANYPNIRFFHITKMGSSTLQDDCKAKWEICTPQTMRATSAVGYFFGRELMQKLNVPIGLIVTAWGGTPAEVWTPKEKIDNDPILNANRIDREYDWWPTKAGVTYNSMIHPIVPYGIAGAIWYQGEANVTKPAYYAQLMKTLITSWRENFGKEFPFYFVQIAPFTYSNEEYAYLLREQQQKMMEIPKTGMVIIGDLVDDVKDIHPKNKTDVGVRLANWALNDTYGLKTAPYKNPSFESIRILKNSVEVTFKNAEGGLISTGKSPQRFVIAGNDRKFIPAKATIDGNRVILSVKEIKNPVAVRFCFDNATTPDLFGKSGLPVAPFRTDNW